VEYIIDELLWEIWQKAGGDKMRCKVEYEMEDGIKSVEIEFTDDSIGRYTMSLVVAMLKASDYAVVVRE